MSGLDAEASRRYPIPQYIPPSKYQSDKGEDDMYPFNHLGFNLGDVEERNEDILKNLTLFAPFSHEDDIQPGNVHLERPVTPINDQIKAPPATFQKLGKLVRRRIVPRPEIEHLGLEEQKELAAIVMGEVNGIWADLRAQVEDPFLTNDENKELVRRITVHVVTVCEQLFIHYLHKAQILNKRGVFSGPANMSRLKAQLALDANKFLKILTIRRYIVGDLKTERDAGSDVSGDTRKPGLPEQHFPLLSYKGLLEASRPKSRTRKKKFASPQEDILELTENMPDLDTSKLLSLLHDLPTERGPSQVTDLFPSKSRVSKEKALARKTSEDFSREKVLLRKSDSAPLLTHSESLLDDMGVRGKRSGSALSLGDIEEEAEPTGRSPSEVESIVKKPTPGTWEYQQEDLRRLVGRGAEDDNQDGADSEEDLPPLLQALTGTEKQEVRRQEIEQQLKEMEKIEEKRRAEERIEIREPVYPQPATVSTRLPNKMVVRTSDIRVSDRVCLSSITLDKNKTVYNDLIDEIDPAMVKKLDSNLFLGDEITEVYKEIMKTVPTDHLDMENDDQIEAAADSLNLSSALASSMLSKKKSERIINPALHRDIEPPWGSLDIRDWAKTPFSPPKDMRGRPIINPMVPKGEGLANNNFYGEGVEGPTVPPPNTQGVGEMPEVMARTYASWLIWWKNTLNSDDYMKYLSTQESDYMGAIFHFYNSDEEDEDSDQEENIHPGHMNPGHVTAPSRPAKKTRQGQEEEKIKKVKDLKNKKVEYKEGFWNVNSILLGGLGKEPTVDDDDIENTSKPAQLDVPPAQVTRNKSFVVSRKSQQASDSSSRGNTREGVLSRQSQTDTKASSSAKQKSEEKEPSAQERLEKVWTMLRMPDNLRLDMAIKYSSDDYHGRLDEAIDVWEQVTHLVMQRENLVAKLEEFERLASDPNRFFEKGQRGSSVARLEEARIRSHYYKKIEHIEDDLKSILQYLLREFNDSVTFQGRPYVDKMQWDRTEMLHWLQEERKHQAMEYEARIHNLAPLSLKLAQLDPLTTPQQSTTVK